MVKHQRCFPVVIFLLILSTFSVDDVWILLGENWYWSPLKYCWKILWIQLSFLVPSQPKSLKCSNVFKNFWIAWVTIFVHLAILTFRKKLDSPKGEFTGLLLLGLTLDRNIVLYENEKFTKTDSHPWSRSMGLVNNYTEMILICGLPFSCETHFFPHKIKGIQFKDFSLGIFL